MTAPQSPDPGWEAYMQGQAEAQADAFEPSAGELERDALLADAELIVRDAYLRAEAEPKVYPALGEEADPQAPVPYTLTPQAEAFLLSVPEPGNDEPEAGS